MASNVLELPVLTVATPPAEDAADWRDCLDAAGEEIKRARRLSRDGRSIERKLRREAILRAIDALDRAGEVLP